MFEHKNGLITIIFKKEKQKDKNSEREQIKKQLEEFNFSKLTQDHIFLSRAKNKQIRFLRITQNCNRSIVPDRGFIKKMFIDGCTIRDVLQSKQERMLYSQGYQRNVDSNITMSPQFIRKHPHETIQNYSRQTQRPRGALKLSKNQDQIYDEYCQIHLNKQILKQEEDIQQSTEASSSYKKNSRFTIRQRKVDRKHFLKDQSLQNKKIDKNAVMELKKEIFKLYSHPQLSPENISAKSYVIFEYFQDKIKSNQKLSNSVIHSAFNSKINLQVASLTKIMTFLVALQICQKYNIDLKNTYKRIGNFQCKIEGTSAQLQSGEMYSIEALFYGLMLPSGNDASIALSVFCGQILEKNNHKKDIQQENNNKQSFYRKFILEMNKKCNNLGMKRTFYSNSHGLANSLNKGCSSDLIILIDNALRKPLFRKVINSTQFSINVQVIKKGSSSSNYKQVMWQNTHELLKTMPQIYKGIKTGTTQAAGHCLASLLQIKGREYVIIVLNSKSNKWRYRDTERLRSWLQEKQFKLKE